MLENSERTGNISHVKYVRDPSITYSTITASLVLSAVYMKLERLQGR